MSAKTKSIWEAPELSIEDQALVTAYKDAGKPLDDLPYTSEFKQLMKDIGKTKITDAQMHATWKRLLYLRKRGRLPRI